VLKAQRRDFYRTVVIRAVARRLEIQNHHGCSAQLSRRHPERTVSANRIERQSNPWECQEMPERCRPEHVVS
jgi:hypothetical protein